MSTFQTWLNTKFLNEPAWMWAVFFMIATLFLVIWGRILGFFEKAL